MLTRRLAVALSMSAAIAGCGKTAPAGAGDAVAGKEAFVACASCHQVGPSARAGFGPQLNGVVGRAAGSTADFDYSAAMRHSGIVWSQASLGAFIAGPERVVPGTKMRFSSFGWSEQRIADLVAYLQTLPPPAP